jgi:hypothetical protein
MATLSERLSTYFGGTPAKTERTSLYQPDQQQLLQQITQLAQQQAQAGPYQAPQTDFAPIEAQARRQFSERTIPEIATRFLGGDEAGSSAFQGALGGAAAGLEERLAGLRQQSNLQSEQLRLQGQGQQQNQLMNLLQGALTPREYISETPRQPGFGESVLAPLLQTAARAGVGYATGGTSEIIPLLMSLFSQKEGEIGSSPMGGQTYMPQKQTLPSRFGNLANQPFDTGFQMPQF